MKNLFLIPVLMCSLAINAQQQNSAFSLSQAIDYALKNSPSYLNADLDLKNTIYKKNETGAIGLPQINGSADVKDYLDLPTSLLPGAAVGGPPGSFVPIKFGTKYNATVGLSASQLIYNTDYYFGIKATKEIINLARINVLRSKADLYAQVSKAYYGSVISRQRMKLLDANIERIKKLYDDTKALNAQGFVEIIDVERVEVQYNNLVTEKEKVTNMILLSDNVLKFQMGYKISDPIILTDSLTAPDKDENALNLTKLDISKRPEFMALQSQQRIAEMDLNRQKWGYLPTLSGYASYQYNAQRQSLDLFDPRQPWYKIFLVGATLNVSIFDGLQRNYRIQQARVAAAKNLNNIRNLELGAEVEANVAGITYANAYAAMQFQKKNMDLALHVYDVAQKKYVGGTGSNLEITTAGASLTEVQTFYFNALYEMLVAKVDYYKAIGVLVK